MWCLELDSCSQALFSIFSQAVLCSCCWLQIIKMEKKTPSSGGCECWDQILTFTVVSFLVGSKGAGGAGRAQMDPESIKHASWQWWRSTPSRVELAGPQPAGPGRGLIPDVTPGHQFWLLHPIWGSQLKGSICKLEGAEERWVPGRGLQMMRDPHPWTLPQFTPSNLLYCWHWPCWDQCGSRDQPSWCLQPEQLYGTYTMIWVVLM